MLRRSNPGSLDLVLIAGGTIGAVLLIGSLTNALKQNAGSSNQSNLSLIAGAESIGSGVQATQQALGRVYPNAQTVGQTFSTVATSPYGPVVGTLQATVGIAERLFGIGG